MCAWISFHVSQCAGGDTCLICIYHLCVSHHILKCITEVGMSMSLCDVDGILCVCVRACLCVRV